MPDYRIHIFDAVAKDQHVLQATEDTIEVEYVSESDSDADSLYEGHSNKNKKESSLENRELVIHLFGALQDGTSVRVEVTGFQPFFYISVPENEPKRWKTKIEEAVRTKLKENASKFVFEIVQKKKLFGYTGGRTYPFVKLTVPSLRAFYEARKFFMNEYDVRRYKLTECKLYESNIDPMLRFFHIRNLQPCGWINVKGYEEESDDKSLVSIHVDWNDVSPCEAPAGVVTAPFHHAFWDIECYSHDGEFPMAQQGYRRVAKQLWVNATSAEEVGTLLQDAFAKTPGAKISIPPLQHVSLPPKAKEVTGVVNGKDFVQQVKEIWTSREGLNMKEKEEKIQELTKVLDRYFKRIAPIAGDPVIQIGTVSWKTGQAKGIKHIFVLGGCDDVPDAVVHTSKTEKELILDWFAWVKEQNFDVFVGYNIFGFDEKYVWQRCCELGIEQNDDVQALSRAIDLGSGVELEEKMLSSAALGDNKLYMWKTPGRLRIDLFGHVKRKVQMGSYKLDAVAASFLSGKLSGIQAGSKPNQWILKTKEKGDARIGRYVQVLDELGEDLSDKMPIIEISADGFVVESEEELTAVTGEAVKWAVVKDDVPPKEIFRLHRGSNADRAKVAAYCVQDCDLVLELYRKLEVFNEAMSMANVCSVPVSYIFTRGQGIKIESLIFKDCMVANQLIEVLPNAQQGNVEAGAETYEGAIVLDPEPGFYTEAPVGVCDFASLYPSTIISENISHDMLVWVKDYDSKGNVVCVKYGSEKAELLAPPGTRFTDIEFDIWRPDPEDKRKNPTKIKDGIRVCRYAQPEGDVKGSLPTIVAKLLAARKAKRNEMAKTDDQFKKALLDAEQNAYKVTANSLYGQLGSGTFKIRLQHLAASVTSYGRKQIIFAKTAIEKFYGPGANNPHCEASEAKIVYGDSVTGDTPLYIQQEGQKNPEISRIDNLCNLGSWASWHETKEAVQVPDGKLRVWTENGWTNVRRIIRHRLQPGKRMFRILTHTGVVDCTEDHSLVHADGSDCKPSDVAIGTPLLHNYAIDKEYSKSVIDEVSKEEAWAMGFFLADGSADVYDCPSGIKATWAVNKADTILLKKVASNLPFPTKILDTIESSGVYKLVPSGKIKSHAIRYRELFYNKQREKRVPPCILNASNEVIQNFLDGFYSGDGDKANGCGYVRWDQKGKEVSTGLYILARRLGYTVSMNDREDKQNVFRMTLTKKAQRKNPIQIKKIRELPTIGIEYVYDIETENHHFAVGPGALVVHNTDSIFVCFNPKNPVTGERLKGREAIVKTIELTEAAGKFITGALKAPHDFEYDKVFYPFIIFSKKRYVGNKYEDNPDEFKETSMGIVLKRRDNAPLLKMCYGSAVDCLLNRRDIPGAIKCVKDKVKELVEGKMKLSQLTITKSLRAEYSSSVSLPPHKMLADRITARDPGNAPASGDRIGFVYIKPPPGQQASKLQGERVETPQYIVEQNLKVDPEYYIEHQLFNPLSQLFGLMVEQFPGFVAPREWPSDPNKRVAHREVMAGDLLFKEALQACRSISKREFVSKMFGSVTVLNETTSKESAPKRVVTSNVQLQPKSKQGMLTDFFRDKSFIEDQRLAKDIMKSKKSKKGLDKA
jgi:DNA polymerase elongation subunit (family B)